VRSLTVAAAVLDPSATGRTVTAWAEAGSTARSPVPLRTIRVPPSVEAFVAEIAVIVGSLYP
jgi:hypothetical protein